MKTSLASCALLLLAIASWAQTSSTTTKGTFILHDPDNVLGQGPVNLNSTNATYAAAATFDAATPAQIDGIQFGASPTAASGGIFTLDFNNGTNAIGIGTFNIDATNSNATLAFTNGATSTQCPAAFGTITISAMTKNPAATTTAAFSNLQGSFDLTCSNVASTLNGTFGFTASASTPGKPPGSGGGSASGQIPVPKLPGGNPTTPSTPSTPAPPPTPTLTVSGPVQTLLGPVVVSTGNPATLTFTTVGGSGFNSPVALTATSSQAGPTFTFSRDIIPAPGTGTSILTVGTASAFPGTFLVTVNASGAGLSSSSTFELDVLCDPPMISGLSEPSSTTVASGKAAQLTVSPLGSGPFTYQWYEGFHGFTSSPIDGATGATLTTPPITRTTQFWVRVSNACGSVDSTTATVTVSH